MATGDREPPFLSERRALGLLAASVLATGGYAIATGIQPLESVVFFVIFAVVFTALNYAVWRYD